MDRPSGPAVVLTREPDDNRELKEALGDRQVPVREIPCVLTRYLQPDHLPEGPCQAVCFTSRRGVRGLVRADLVALLMPPGQSVLIAATGKATASEARAAGLRVDLVAEPPLGSVLAERLCERLPPGSRIAVVRGNLWAGGMDQILQEAGYELVPLEVYSNDPPEIPVLEPFLVAAVFVASPSAARRLLQNNPWMARHTFGAIGPTTHAALAELGVAKVEDMGAHPERWAEILCSLYRRANRSEAP